MAVLSANTIFAPEAASVFLEQVDQSLVLARTIWNNPGGDELKVGAGHVVNVSVPSIGMAREVENGGKITSTFLDNHIVSILLKKTLYEQKVVTDVEMTSIGLERFSAEVLAVVAKSLARRIEHNVAATMRANQSTFNITATKNKVVEAIGTAVGMLGAAYVPMDDLTIAVNPMMGAVIAADPAVRQGTPFNESALSLATIGRLHGANVVVSPEIELDKIRVYHKTAFVLASRTPLRAHPEQADRWMRGVGANATNSHFSIAVDYDRAADRLADTITGSIIMGTGVVKDKGKITGSSDKAVFTPFDLVSDESTHGQLQFIRCVTITVSS